MIRYIFTDKIVKTNIEFKVLQESEMKICLIGEESQISMLTFVLNYVLKLFVINHAFF